MDTKIATNPHSDILIAFFILHWFMYAIVPGSIMLLDICMYGIGSCLLIFKQANINDIPKTIIYLRLSRCHWRIDVPFTINVSLVCIKLFQININATKPVNKYELVINLDLLVLVHIIAIINATLNKTTIVYMDLLIKRFVKNKINGLNIRYANNILV